MNDPFETITVDSKETLSVSGVNNITIQALELKDGATIQFNVTETALTAPVLNLDAELRANSLSLSLSRNALTKGENYTILSLADDSQYDRTSWTPDKVSLKGDKSSFYDYSWNNGDLIYNYRSAYQNNSYSYIGKGERSSYRIFSDYLRIRFENNFSMYDSGSVMQTSQYSPASFKDNGEIIFKNNKVTNIYRNGGAIDGPATFSGNGSISFIENSAAWYGGAMIGSGTYMNNDYIIFKKNTASYGGALTEGTFTNNRQVIFSENQASTGGAIYATTSVPSFTGNGEILFTDNRAGGGSAIYYDDSQSKELDFINNKNITFINNLTEGGVGGTIYAPRGIHFNNNGAINLSWNTSSYGKANSPLASIFVRFNSLTFLNNDSVLLRGNAVINDSTYYLRGIFVEGAISDAPTRFSLSTQKGQTITFHDSIYAGENTVTTLNESGSGLITFSGETTVEDLNTILVSRNENRCVTDSDSEVTMSRTSELLGTTTLYGGSLIIKEKAILNISDLRVEGGDIIVATGAQLNLSLRDTSMPSLTLAGGTVTLGTEDDHAAALTVSSLTVTDNSTLNADLVLADNGSITFDFSGSDEKKLTMGCSVTLGNDYTVYLDHATITMLMSDEHAEGLTLIQDIETIRDILLADNVRAYDTTTNEESDILLYTQTESDGTKSLRARRATPEPATATLSLLALAAFAARCRRH